MPPTQVSKRAVSLALPVCYCATMQIDEVDIKAITRHPKNARQGEVSRIAESIKVNGFFAPLVVQRSSGHILVGNHRYQAACDTGMTTIPVYYVDCDDAQARRIMLADNKTSDRARYEKDVLAELLQEALGDGGLFGTAFDPSEVDKLLQEASAGDAPTVEQFDLIPYERTFFLVAAPLSLHATIADALDRLQMEHEEIDYEHAQDSQEDPPVLQSEEGQERELASGRESVVESGDNSLDW